MSRAIAILLYLFFACSQAKGTVDSARFVHFDLSNGLPSNNVYSLVKDKYGYTWLATDKGVSRYNGYSFAVYNTSNGLPEDDIWELTPDNHGRVWVHSFAYGFGYIKNGQYNKLNVDPIDRIFAAYYLSQAGDVVYFFSGTDSIGELVFVADELIKTFPFSRSAGIQKELGIIDFNMGDNLSLYVMNREEEVYEWGLLRGNNKYKFVRKANDEALKYGFRFRRNLSPRDELYSFRFNGKTLYRHSYQEKGDDVPLTLGSMGGDAEERIYAFNSYFLKDNRNEYSSLITNSHLYTIDRNFKFLKRERIRDIVPTKSQLSYHVVDKWENNWYATKGDGVWALPVSQGLSAYVRSGSDLENTVYLGIVGTKSYWWSRAELLLYTLDRNVVSERIRFPKGSSIKSVTGSEDSVYIGGESGLYLFMRKDNSLEAFENLYHCVVEADENRAPHRTIMHEKGAFEYIHLVKEVSGNIYSAGSEYIMLHNIRHDSVITQLKISERFIGMLVSPSAIIFYNSQKILVQSRISGHKTEFDLNFLKSLGIGSLKQIERDAFNNLYFLSNEKLYVCNTELKKFGVVDLNVNMREAHLRIVGNKLVLAGTFGIGFSDIIGPGRWGEMKVLPNYIVSKPYYNQVVDLSVTEDGFIVLRTDKNIFSLTLDELRSSTSTIKTPDALQLMLEVPYTKVVSRTDTFAIEQESQKLKLGVISYHGKGTPKYSYKLPGDLNWQESESGEILISSLLPGEYHKIVCKVKDDVWHGREYTVYLYRYPYWWQTDTWRTIYWLSALAIFLILVLVIVLVTRYYVAKKNERKRALTELELQAIHSQINPHFIFNTLSTALFYISRKRLDDAYTHVHRFSQLLRSYLKSSQDRYIILEEEIKMLRTYIELQQIRFEEKFEYRVYVDNKLPLASIRIPSLLLQPLVENAINHGLFHRETGGLLQLKFEQGKDNTELVCTIEDNGIGRSAAKRINENSSNKRESYGTKLTHQLLEVFKQYEHLDIKLEYIDKEFPETGTIVTLTLKNIKYVTSLDR